MQTAGKTIVSCTVENAVATIVMGDGKRNVISLNMLQQLNTALDQAERANAIVILTGEGDTFSAGFDLGVLKSGVLNAFAMLIGGFALSRRLLSFPTPVIVACNGHALAMGAFLLLSGDYRIGVERIGVEGTESAGEVKIAANEVAIGLTMPHSAVEICRQRLTPANFDRAVLLSEMYNSQSAVTAGFLDAIVSKESLLVEANKRAQQYAQLDLTAHKNSKLRMRRGMLKSLSRAIRADKIDFVKRGVQRLFVRKPK